MKTGAPRVSAFPGRRIAAALGAAVVAVGISGLAAAAEAEGPQSRLMEIERALEQSREATRQSRERAEALGAEVAKLRRQMIAAAKTAQRHEAEITRLEGRLDELARAEAGKLSELRGRRDQSAQVLMALGRMARHPPEALLAQPLSADDMVRSAILLRTAVPRLEQRSAALRQELDQLAALRAEAGARRRQMAAAVSGLEDEHKRLDTLIRRKTALRATAESAADEARRRIEALAQEATDIRDLMVRLEAERRARLEAERQARLEAERQARREAERLARLEAEQQARLEAERKRVETEAAAKAEAARLAAIEEEKRRNEREMAARTQVGVGFGSEIVPITKARGRLPFPVAGRVVGQYGQTTEAGLTRKGISIEARSGAWVIAPYDGIVVYAGQFRGYGQILILEHGEGYHTLLAGLARIDAAMGQWLAAGEPVGLMAQSDHGNPVLYVELRRDGQPINPLPWLASQKDKVSG